MEKNNDDIKVSVLVITYNHEKFLRECLDSIVCQKTNFKFEVIIHDDKSTDGSVQIIEEYRKKYSNLIVPIYEEENQYSKGKSIIEECILPYAKGKYIALCESDDRWCDENKLQKQYDFMEAHLDYVACFHNTIMHDLSGKKPDSLRNNIRKQTTISVKQAITFIVHTTSYFVRKEQFKKLVFGKSCLMGDYVLFTSLYTYAKMAVLPDIMSVYNYNNPHGVTESEINTSKFFKYIDQQIDYLKQFDEYTKNKHSKLINNYIMILQTRGIFLLSDESLLKEASKKDYKKKLKETRNSDAYKKVMKGKIFTYKVKIFIKYHLPRKLFIYLKNKG